jgi:hypothetical protein
MIIPCKAQAERAWKAMRTIFTRHALIDAEIVGFVLLGVVYVTNSRLGFDIGG